MRKLQKVFGIGFHKTGTKSLGKALKILGYSVCGPVATRNPDIADEALGIALRHAEQFDAVQDNPFPLLFRELDAAFPGSKFILTTEDPDVWTVRALRYFGANETPMRQWIYGKGSPVGNEALYRARFIRHNESVREYFAGRKNDILEWHLTANPNWDPLCNFLGVSFPADLDFPHVNKGVKNMSPSKSMDSTHLST